MAQLEAGHNETDGRTDQIPVVGIGASAGGLDAFLEFLGELHGDTGLAFVLVQHLEPHHESQLAEILARATAMPVVQASDEQSVEANHIYVIPPNHALTIQNRTLRLSPRENGGNPHYPIDRFFSSLAEDLGSAAIGVILSGTGSDGAQGLKAIKDKNGITFCQDEASARFGGMPRSAVQTGAVDFVLPPVEIARTLARIRTEHPEPRRPVEEESEPPASDGEFDRVIELLRNATDVDFRQYKQSTIRRRTARRIALQHMDSLSEYVRHLESHPSEIIALHRDILIGVTSFFREEAMFAALSAALTPIVADRSPKDPFRIWIAGCATGEEAYSICMTVFEVMERTGKDTPIQLFGTDISETAIERARSGVYPTSIEETISPERIAKFFNRVDSGYRIKQSIRESCVFAKHDLTVDPPFSQMDLVSCRNVLIYLNSVVQQRILPALHYSLKAGGLLVLGTAETISTRGDLFEVLDSPNKIFVKKFVPTRFGEFLPMARGAQPERIVHGQTEVLTPSLAEIEARGSNILRNLYAPPGVIVSDSMQVLRFHGDTGFFLEQQPGEASLHLLQLARESLVFPLRRAVSGAIERNESVSEAGVRVVRGSETRVITVRVIPISTAPVRCYLVLFDEGSPGPPSPAGVLQSEPESGPERVLDSQLVQTRRELGDTREYLRKIIEQHEAATEELKSANEEARSSNEELQSTNEELRTTKEELQSSNEELITVNEELRHRNDELNIATNDLNNVFSAVEIPVVLVDRDLCVRRFTPAAGWLMDINASDIGRKVGDAFFNFGKLNVRSMLEKTIARLEVQQGKAQDGRGRWYSLFTRPYRTLDDRIDGAVLSFIDIDEVTRALEDAIGARDFSEGIVETVQHPLLVLDHDLRIRRATAAFYKTFLVKPSETIGQFIYEVGNRQWDIPELRKLLDETLLRDIPFRDVDVEHVFPDIGRRTMRINARRINGSEHRASTLLLAIEDMTDRKEAAEVQYRRLFESAKDAIIILDAASGIVLDLNPYFNELTRYRREELIGKPFWEIPPFLAAEEGGRLVQEVKEQDTAKYDSVKLESRDGREIIVDITANRYRVKNAVLIQVNIRDVTEKQRGEETLRRSNLDLQQFAFAASHDLQEPLRTVTSYLQLLERQYGGTLGEQAGEYIRYVTSAADRMRQMVLDLLSYSQIVRSEGTIAPVHVETVLSTAMMNLQMAISSSEASITFDPLPVVMMDQVHLLQLLQNLISNSIKYRAEERPHIHLSAREAGPDWVLSVRDNGLGIDPKYAEHIFTVFKRLHGREYPGTGIGLALCKRIVERYGGRIWVESKPGAGATFYFTLPRPKVVT